MKSFLSLLVVMGFTLIVDGQTYFQKNFGNDGSDQAFHVQQTSDLGFVLVGRADGTGEDQSNHLYLVKTDAEGNEEWSQVYDSLGVIRGTCVRQTPDLGFIVSGANYSSFDGDSLTLTKVSPEGIEAWTKSYDLLRFGYGENIIVTDDGGFIICGFTIIDDNQHIKVIKTDNVGNVTWSQVYESQENQRAQSIIQTDDGNYALCGNSEGSNSNIILMKTGEDGELIWSQTYNGGDEVPTTCYSLDVSSDNGFILLGFVEVYTAESLFKYFLLKTDDEGNEDWSNTYFAYDESRGVAVKTADDGGFIMTGWVFDYGPIVTLMYCVKTDQEGSTEWEQTFVESFRSRGYSSIVTEDGGFAFAGTASVAGFSNQAFLVKTDSSGTVGVESLQSPNNKTFVYPNPFSNSATLHLSHSTDKNFEVNIFDVYGKAVRSLENVSQSVKLERDNLERGIYYYQVLENRRLYSSGNFLIK